jgi:tRNA (guanosine-2'-O-)-methyltransferase
MSRPVTLPALLDRYGADEIVSRLSSLVTQERLQRIRKVLDSRIRHVQVGIEEPSDIHNALAVTRSCEAFGVDRLHIVSSQVERNPRNIGRRTTRGTLHWVHTEHHPALDSFLDAARAGGLRLAGAVGGEGLALEELPLEEPVCLLFGNEHRGLSPRALEHCDFRFHIPLQGMVTSLNLSVAAAISIYSTTARYRSGIKTDGDLSAEEKRAELAWHLCRHLGTDKAETILKTVS